MTNMNSIVECHQILPYCFDLMIFKIEAKIKIF